jgi:hypothetical protein
VASAWLLRVQSGGKLMMTMRVSLKRYDGGQLRTKFVPEGEWLGTYDLAGEILNGKPLLSSRRRCLQNRNQGVVYSPEPRITCEETRVTHRVVSIPLVWTPPLKNGDWLPFLRVSGRHHCEIDRGEGRRVTGVKDSRRSSGGSTFL